MSFRSSLGDHVVLRRGVDAQSSAAATVNGAAIDRSNFDSVVLAVSVGAATGAPTAQTVDAKLQDSADGSTGWADVAGAAITQVTANNQVAIKGANLAAVKKFVRAVVIVGFTGGTSPAIPVSATLVLSGHRDWPVS